MRRYKDENKSVFFSTHITTDLDKIADYVTFIDNGKIIFSSTKEDILDNYAVIKGANHLLSSTIKSELIGIRENKFGFEGLVSNKRKYEKVFKDKVIIERPTLEDIIIFYARRSKHA